MEKSRNEGKYMGIQAEVLWPVLVQHLVRRELA
jgi:hypothetical protein